MLRRMERVRTWPVILALMAPICLAQQTNLAPITVKVRMTHNRMVIPAKINDTPLHLLLDSACTIPTLHPEVVEELKLQSSGSVRIAGIAGEERAPTFRGIVIDMGEAKYAPRRVASIPSERSE